MLFSWNLGFGGAGEALPVESAGAVYRHRPLRHIYPSTALSPLLLFIRTENENLLAMRASDLFLELRYGLECSSAVRA